MEVNVTLKKRISFFSFIVTLIFSFSFYLGNIYATDSNLSLVEDGYLTVGTCADYPPFEFKSGDKIVGADVELASKIAENLDLKPKFEDMSFDALLLSLATGKLDIVLAGMCSTEEREKVVDFSDPYFHSNQVILVDKNSEIKSSSDLSGKKIGAQIGTTGCQYCIDTFGNPLTYNSNIDAVLDLEKGQIDAVVMDELPARRFLNKKGDKIKVLEEYLFSEDIRIAIPKGHNALKDAINKILPTLSLSFVQQKIEEYSSDNPNIDSNNENSNNNHNPNIVEQFRMNLIDESRWKNIVKGLFLTFKITIVSLIIGVLLGYLTAITILSPSKTFLMNFLKSIAKTYVSIIRGTPVVCQLFIVYYLILSPLGISKVVCAMVAFGINSGAYVSEIIRSGILSVDIGQIEAGKALGLNDNQIMKNIIAPQALKNSLATLCNEFMQLIKETSVAGFIGVTELTRAGEIIRSQTLSPFVPLMTTALIYFSIVHLIGMLMSFFERRLRESDKN